MKRHELEHVIRAAGAIAGSTQLYIIGSQAILGMYPDAPLELLMSQKVDTWPAEDPAKADLIDGSIGELSPFLDTFGYYAHGIGPETAVLPVKWESRVVVIENENTHGVRGLCLHPADLAVSKLVAGRDKDMLFVAAMLRHHLVRTEEIQRLIHEELVPARRAETSSRLCQLAGVG